MEFFDVEVLNIDKHVTCAELEMLFSNIPGFIKVSINESNQSSQCNQGCATFSSEESAHEAINRYNHIRINGTPLKLLVKPKRIESRIKGYLIKVSGLKNWDENILYEVFLCFGEILDYSICTTTGETYGLIRFKDRSSAQEAIQMMDREFLFGKMLTVTRFLESPPNKSFSEFGARVILKNFNVPEEEILNVLSSYGEVVDHKFQFSKSGGFGFVVFKNSSDAEMAIEELHDTELMGADSIGKHLKISLSGTHRKI